MDKLTAAISELASKTGAVSSKEIINLIQLAETLGIRFNFTVTSEKFAEISFVGAVTAVEDKVTLGTISLTLKLLH